MGSCPHRGVMEEANTLMQQSTVLHEGDQGKYERQGVL